MPKLLRNASCAKCRRAGEKLLLKGEKCLSPKCPIIKRNYPPGMHGPGRHGRLTGYGEQLKEKQKAKRIYGLRERAFGNYIAKASGQKGNTSEHLLNLLETRLDNVVYRLGFAKSRQAARQLVNHGHFLVNGKKVNIPSYQVKAGQEITLRSQSKASKVFENLGASLAKKELLPWLNVNAETLVGKVIGLPKMADTQMNFDFTKIIEFYSR